MDSAPSIIVSAASPPQAVPMPPILDSPVFDKLRAAIHITMPSVDVNGDPLTVITGVKLFYGPSGTDILALPPKEFSGPFDVGGVGYSLEVDVPTWNTEYDFMAEVSI